MPEITALNNKSDEVVNEDTYEVDHIKNYNQNIITLSPPVQQYSRKFNLIVLTTI